MKENFCFSQDIKKKKNFPSSQITDKTPNFRLTETVDCLTWERIFFFQFDLVRFKASRARTGACVKNLQVSLIHRKIYLTFLSCLVGRNLLPARLYNDIKINTGAEDVMKFWFRKFGRWMKRKKKKYSLTNTRRKRLTAS